MSELQPAARQVMALRLVESFVKDQLSTARGGLVNEMGQLGVERVRVSDEAGTDLGTVSLAAGRVTAKVVDEAAFLRWVKHNHPTEVVETVRDSFRKKLFDGAVAKAEPDDPTAVGPDGEVIPGVELVHNQPYPTCRPTDEAKQRMGALLADVLALPAGPAAAPVDGGEVRG